jgi:hypothetical protein
MQRQTYISLDASLLNASRIVWELRAAALLISKGAVRKPTSADLGQGAAAWVKSQPKITAEVFNQAMTEVRAMPKEERAACLRAAGFEGDADAERRSFRQ